MKNYITNNEARKHGTPIDVNTPLVRTFAEITNRTREDALKLILRGNTLNPEESQQLSIALNRNDRELAVA